jgi:glucosamine--fructose-6-phosphate aminotransferase (isomerizing)
MCGIFGVSQSPHAGDDVIAGLKRLEYRGYDSWGVAVMPEVAGVPAVMKHTGKIGEVTEHATAGTSAIGHTRWATHGGVTTKNAHPHRAGSVTLVHNGILENHEALKTPLSKKHTFVSDTDTEVFAALVNEHYRKTKHPLRALRRAVAVAEGRFAIAVFFDGDPHLYVARRGSPLIVGRGKRSTYIASDIPALIPHTRTIEFLEDNECAVIDGASVTYRSLVTGREIDKQSTEVGMSIEDAQLGDFPHFMLKEIFEQRTTIAAAGRAPEDTVLQAAKALQKATRIYLVGSGTAHKACAVAQYFFAEHAQREVTVIPPAELGSFVQFLKGPETVVCAVSQSGETADVLEPFETAKKSGATCISITNSPSSSIARISDIHIDITAGPERAVASTKALTAQVTVLYLLAHATSTNGRTTTRITHARGQVRTAARKIAAWLMPRKSEDIKTLAKKIVRHNDLFIIGRNVFYPMALETAIKVQEVSYIHAQGFSAGELKHGPLALITNGTPVLVLGDEPDTLSNAQEAKSRGAFVIGVSPKNASVFDEWVHVPPCDELQALATVIPSQLLAYHLAILRKLDPDKPRNLAKSVTVK